MGIYIGWKSRVPNMDQQLEMIVAIDWNSWRHSERLEILMASEGKRKFYKNQLVGQRSMACVPDGQVYLYLHHGVHGRTPLDGNR